ncbi:MAG: bifunctional folylpolyglutamate synthase/dihydrofolate synthase [Bacteroidota bacterium]
MTYQETLDFLYGSLPMFQRIGAAAFKKDLSNTLVLCAHVGNPEKRFRSIHVGGTNGKGSTSHALASILQASGYKTGLYTSPHLKSFTERIRINGKEITEDAVVDFVKINKAFLEELSPSFFEMTVGLAFWYFAKQKVDIAVIEVGMGGRLDSTNVITPELSVITNIGLDHTQFLGDTLPAIAGEKAGIIKERVPVVISQMQAETAEVFERKAKQMHADLIFADRHWKIDFVEASDNKANLKKFLVSHHDTQEEFTLGLGGNYQRYNLAGILEAVTQLRRLGWEIPDQAVREGLLQVAKQTGLKGRWQVLQHQPLLVADTAHNEAGIREVVAQLSSLSYSRLWMVIGMVQDKDITAMLELLPKNASYVFCQANIPRALEATTLAEKANSHSLRGIVIPDVGEAIAFARKNAGPNDLIFIGGSTFVVAEINNL